MYFYSTLENTPVQTLHRAYQEAFKDFPSTKHVSLESFQDMLRRRGYDSGISLGAFEDSTQTLAGFILNGFRVWKGKRTAYDILTGTGPSYRRQGIADTMFEKLKVLLRQRDAEQYLTETKKDNTSAIELYKKQGFEIRRGLSSYILHRKNHRKTTPAFKVECPAGIKQNEWERFASFWEFEPSWQNSIASIIAVQGTMMYALVRLDDDIVGYGVLDTSTGDIPQLAVHKAYRRRGIAGNIVSVLFEKVATDQLSIFNVDDNCGSMNLFLSKSGFEKFLSQYEVVLTL